jgi:transcriptional regulator with XRE-family HTH domain
MTANGEEVSPGPESPRASIHDPRYAEFVARLRAARRQSGLTQSQVAVKLGRTQAFVSKVETCERRLDLIETLDLCVVLGIDLASLLPEALRPLASPAVEPDRNQDRE